MRSFAASENRKSVLRWLERALLLIALLCLGAYAYAWLDTSITQYRENRLLEESLNAAPPAAGLARPLAAAETDSLESFREPGRSGERLEPGPEGSLIGRIEVPRLGVSAIVLEGIGRKTLRRAVGRIPGTGLPGVGNVGLAGHRDSFFRGLKDVRKNDIITLKTLAGTYRYHVEWTDVVEPEDTHVLEDTGSPALTLVTCYPFYYVGSAPKRFIVRAKPVGGQEGPVPVGEAPGVE